MSLRSTVSLDILMTYSIRVFLPAWRASRVGVFMSVALAAAATAVALPPPLEAPRASSLPGRVDKLAPDEDTRFLLESDGIDFHDAAGRIPAAAIQVVNGEMVDDPCGLSVLRFGEKPGSITVKDDGRIDFAEGLTIEAWVFLEAPMLEKQTFGFAEKPHRQWDRHAFALTLVPGHFLTLGHLGFVGEKIDGAPVPGREHRPLKPVEWYPGRGNTMNGLNAFPAGKWTHLAFTYDRGRRLLRTWVDGGLDRQAFNPWYEVASELVDDDHEPVILLKGATNLRVAQIRLSRATREIGPVPPVKIHVAELPYRNCHYVTLIPTAAQLPLPLEVTVMNIRPPVLNAVNRFVLNDRVMHHYPIPAHVWACSESELAVRLFHQGREIFRHDSYLMNAKMDNPSTWRFLRGGPWGVGPQRPAWWIDEDNRITHHGTNVFPLGIYHVTTNDFELVASLGFTMIGLRKDDGSKLSNQAWYQVKEPYYAKAAALGVTLFADDNVIDRPGEGFIYAFDEPWGFSLEPIRRRYQALRSARERPAELPVVATQNNWQRYRETGLACDILAVDPYCRGRMPLRFVHDATHAARRETDFLKPVLTIVDSYGSERMRPSFDELRTMSYLGVIGGASALSYYAWDDGVVDDIPTNTRDLPEHVANFRRLLAELRELTPILAMPNLAEAPAFEPAAPRGFFACAKQGPDRRLYLIVASDLYQSETRTLRCAALAGQTAVLTHGPATAGASETLVFDADGRTTVTLPALGTAVFAGKPTGAQ